MADIEKVIKELDRMTEEARAMDLEWAIGIDDFATLCEALELLKDQKAVHDRTMRIIWDTLHEGLSIDTVPDQDWVYERIRHRIEDT